MKRLALATLAILLLLPMHGSGQNNWRVLWTASDNISNSAAAAGADYRLYVNNGTAVLLPQATCTGSQPQISCQAALPQALIGVATLPGARVELTATLPGSPESPRSAPFLSGASAPTGLSLSR